MRPDEEFVGKALANYFGGPGKASVSHGSDPPDICLTVGTTSIGVEVTQLSQFTLEPDGTLGNRMTQDFFGLRLLDGLNSQVGPSLPADVSLLVGLWVPVLNAARFRRAVSEWVKSVASSPKMGFKEECQIDGSKVTISVIPERPSGKKIVGFVCNKNSSADIGLNARLVLEDRIRRKNDICCSLPKPIWLAVLNDYWLADENTYLLAARTIELAHCFERIFLVSDEGKVSEIKTGA